MKGRASTNAHAHTRTAEGFEREVGFSAIYREQCHLLVLSKLLFEHLGAWDVFRVAEPIRLRHGPKATCQKRSNVM